MESPDGMDLAWAFKNSPGIVRSSCVELAAGSSLCPGVVVEETGRPAIPAPPLSQPNEGRLCCSHLSENVIQKRHLQPQFFQLIQKKISPSDPHSVRNLQAPARLCKEAPAAHRPQVHLLNKIWNAKPGGLGGRQPRPGPGCLR